MRNDRLWALLTLALLILFVLATGAVARDVIAARPPETVPVPVAVAETVPLPASTDAEAVDPARLADKLDDPMAQSGIVEGLSAYVVDAETHQELYARDADEGVVPASTTKVVTAVAVLHEVGPDARIETRVVRGAAPDEVVLVGGGDPTLTENADPDRYPRLASLEELADQTAQALAEAGVTTVRLGYDDSAYTGDSLGPGWKQGYIDEGSTAAVHALMLDCGIAEVVDECGRIGLPSESKYGTRVSDPPLAAAEAFARKLEQAGVTVAGTPQAVQAPQDAEPLATASSPPISALVEKTLMDSENNVAEALARQVAIARGEEPSFEGAARAVMAVMDELGVTGVQVSDGSGLSVDTRITSRALAELLVLATDPDRPELYPTLSGLPTAYATGSLAGRYSPESGAAGGAGVIRAKTGTLNEVSALAGTIYTAQGRLLVFAFVANHPAATGSALDTLAAAVAECGC
ncbi:D-alanyl-D-alanine carboxypeptidase/D-alanyl-D-alanine endopeptidase [Thermobifida cellulosilytica]|uniref:Peptidase S13 n=1 Tax=Thermobifida cellulosilytica TB100 TaxID=665004 RepID=A0A147KDR8_THECS|nr:D-alanyl-D-alanine carboxypeptidase/D-alanyl-D-alanine-endopeptidase [Thermobifida cellulosilytica]KUP95425.1 peptidase S13 [Thermobifida cellulosilytica TB100]